ncbi:hypothetical protein X772_31110 [Mesorhizobium sp. LSJC280B00]|nr:hypothetical protein X772_31110 [Mesorhizobium sp. LSJC280B00]
MYVSSTWHFQSRYACAGVIGDPLLEASIIVVRAPIWEKVRDNLIVALQRATRFSWRCDHS